jgi:hypothetical protein
MRTIAIVFLSTIFLSCNYTIFKSNKIANLTSSPVPDLIITCVSWQPTTIAHTYYTHVYPPSSPPPIPAIEFFVDITNIGKLPYDGVPLIACETKNDIGWNNYPYVSKSSKKFYIIPNDTMTLNIVVPINPTSATGLYRFLLVTQHNMPQCVHSFNDISFAQDEQTDNNVFDYVLK